jgi:hypothetical protein
MVTISFVVAGILAGATAFPGAPLPKFVSAQQELQISHT